MDLWDWELVTLRERWFTTFSVGGTEAWEEWLTPGAGLIFKK